MKGVGIKLYVNGDWWEKVKELLPGQPAVITNLIYRIESCPFIFIYCN